MALDNSAHHHTRTYEPIHRTIVSLDIVGSGRRDDQMLLRLRSDLKNMVRATLHRQAIDWDHLDVSDLGDGYRLFVPPDITPAALLDPFVPNLDAALTEHRRAASEAARLQLRVAAHHGLVHRDGPEWVGGSVVLVARLLDGAPVRRAAHGLNEANLVLVVSQLMHETVVVHGYGLDPAIFHRVRIQEKETRTSAWIHVPGRSPAVLAPRVAVRPRHTRRTGPGGQAPVAVPRLLA